MSTSFTDPASKAILTLTHFPQKTSAFIFANLMSSVPLNLTKGPAGLAFDISQSFANLVSSGFEGTCPLGAGQERLRKRTSSLSDHDVQGITNFAKCGLKNAASSHEVQDILLMFPTDFPSITGPLVAAMIHWQHSSKLHHCSTHSRSSEDYFTQSLRYM